MASLFRPRSSTAQQAASSRQPSGSQQRNWSVRKGAGCAGAALRAQREAVACGSLSDCLATVQCPFRDALEPPTDAAAGRLEAAAAEGRQEPQRCRPHVAGPAKCRKPHQRSRFRGGSQARPGVERHPQHNRGVKHVQNTGMNIGTKNKPHPTLQGPPSGSPGALASSG